MSFIDDLNAEFGLGGETPAIGSTEEREKASGPPPLVQQRRREAGEGRSDQVQETVRPPVAGRQRRRIENEECGNVTGFVSLGRLHTLQRKYERRLGDLAISEERFELTAQPGHVQRDRK